MMRCAPAKTRIFASAAIFSLGSFVSLASACKPRGSEHPDENAVTSDAPNDPASNPKGADARPGELNETLGERSQCRSGWIPLPDSKRSLRAIVDDQHGYAVMLPDLKDWAMACGDDPYFVGEAMGGAVSATVYAVEPRDKLDAQAYLNLLAGQLESDVEGAGMQFTDRKLGRTAHGTWVLTFRVVAAADGIEKWQFNYITARQRSDASFVNLQMTVTAVDDGSTHAESERFAESLIAYLEMFRLVSADRS